MANPLQLLLDACNLLAENDQMPTHPSEQPVGKPKEDKGKAPLIHHPNGKAKESKGKAPLLQPDEKAKRSKGKAPIRMTHLKDGPKHGREKTEESCTKLTILGVVPPESSDDDDSPKFDSLGRRRRRRPMKLTITEESKALKEKFDKFKEWQNLERARRSLLQIPPEFPPTGLITRKILLKFPAPPNTSCYPWKKPDERPIKEITEGLKSPWIRVRNPGHKMGETMLADPSLEFSKCRSPKDLSDQWDKERSNMLNNVTPDPDKASSSCQDFDLNKPYVVDSEREDA